MHQDLARRLVNVSDSGGRSTHVGVGITHMSLTWGGTAARRSGVSRVRVICTTNQSVVGFGRGGSRVREMCVNVEIVVGVTVVMLALVGVLAVG